MGYFFPTFLQPIQVTINVMKASVNHPSSENTSTVRIQWQEDFQCGVQIVIQCIRLTYQRSSRHFWRIKPCGIHPPRRDFVNMILQADKWKNSSTMTTAKIPRLYRVPVTTIVGYYDPDRSRSLQSYIYPALHGAYGFVYNDDGGSTNGTPNGCELVVETKDDTLVFELGTSIDWKGMTKFHVNVATEDEPSMATIHCQKELLAKRELDGPKTDGPPLKYTVNGVSFAQTDCNDDNTFTFGPQDRGCEWVRRKKKKTEKRCKKTVGGVKLWDVCFETCGRAGLGVCKDYYD